MPTSRARAPSSCLFSHASIVLAAVLASACGGDDTATSESQGTTTTVTESATEGATEGATDGTATAGPTASASEGMTEGTSDGTTSAGESESESEGETTDATTTAASATETMTEGTTDPTTTGTTTEEEPAGCKKVDFLFVIDNSVSMQGEQAALKAAFPAFIDTIRDTLPTDDYHIMVADTDAQGRCSPQTCGHSTCQAQNQYACQDIFTECDTIRGAGVNHPAGQAASNKLCEFEGGNRYMLSSDPELVDNFICAASVGLAGHPSERPMDAIVEAISAPLNGPGGCNEGFLRDDAILVVTFLSDDPNVEDENSAFDTYGALVTAKNDDEDRIVVLGLIPQPDKGCLNKGGDHWSEMISLFGERGIEGPICAEDYNEFFQGAVSTILDTCILNPL